MNHGTIREMIECATERERHQFYAGAQRVIILTENKLRKQRAEAERRLELGETEDEQ